MDGSAGDGLRTCRCRGQSGSFGGRRRVMRTVSRLSRLERGFLLLWVYRTRKEAGIFWFSGDKTPGSYSIEPRTSTGATPFCCSSFASERSCRGKKLVEGWKTCPTSDGKCSENDVEIERRINGSWFQGRMERFGAVWSEMCCEVQGDPFHRVLLAQLFPQGVDGW